MIEPSITAVGAVTSLGPDAVTSCAAIRAGMSRPQLLDGPLVHNLMDYSDIAITGHPAGTMTRGFSNVGRWLQLLPEAITDLCAAGQLPSPRADPAFWARTGALIIVPVLGERFIPDINCSEQAIEGALVNPLRRRLADCFAPVHARVHAVGRVGLLECVSAACTALERGAFERVAVVAVDSMVDSAALQWLLERGRLRTDSSPTGLSPGEACCAFLLEAPEAARARGASVLARWVTAATAREAPVSQGGRSIRGSALARVIQQVNTGLTGSAGRRGLVVTDLNGEEWRAAELAMAQLELPSTLWDSRVILTPMASTGDVGAATAGLQVAVACRALARGYAGELSVLLTTSGEDGSVGAAIISTSEYE